MSALGFVVVPQVVALNPVAVALQRGKLHRAGRDLALSLHLAGDGASVPVELVSAARVLAVALHLVECTDVRAAADEVEQLRADGARWRVASLRVIDAGLCAALLAIAQAPARHLARACEAASR